MDAEFELTMAPSNDGVTAVMKGKCADGSTLLRPDLPTNSDVKEPTQMKLNSENIAHKTLSTATELPNVNHCSSHDIHNMDSSNTHQKNIGVDASPRPKKLDLLAVPEPGSPTDSIQSSDGSHIAGWAKLRTTVKVAGVVSAKTKKRRKTSGGVSRQDSFMKRFSTRYHRNSIDSQESEDESAAGALLSKARITTKVEGKKPLVVNPDGTFMFYWLAALTVTVLYNLWTCIAREGFPEIMVGYEILWFVLDGICDLFYLVDIVIQLRTGYLERGLVVYNSKKLAKHYVHSRCFFIDILSLIPLDIIQFFIGIHPLLRFPRFLKVYRAYRFSYMVETRTVYPNMWRVANLSHLLFLGSHWFAAFYYMISEAEDFRGSWGYPVPEGEFGQVARKYLKSLYWSTLTLTTIGDLPPPESTEDKATLIQYVFTIVSYLIGVFVFATIVGQVGNVITNRNASRQEFERLLDGAKAYMRNHNVPAEMQRRVQRWYDYAWSRGRVNGGGDINSLGLLPDKLKTELALHVNLETLKKVTIFQECEPEFLHDLVLKMKAYIFTPGDLICRKGEVAREMFIIADGLLEVISDSGEVLTQMGTGDFFGEIGILNLDGGVNRRTADVRSVGYSELFVLSREDVLGALKDHPEAEAFLTKYGRDRLTGLRDRKASAIVATSKLSQPAAPWRPKCALLCEEANPTPITNLLGIYMPNRFDPIGKDQVEKTSCDHPATQSCLSGLPTSIQSTGPSPGGSICDTTSQTTKPVSSHLYMQSTQLHKPSHRHTIHGPHTSASSVDISELDKNKLARSGRQASLPNALVALGMLDSATTPPEQNVQDSHRGISNSEIPVTSPGNETFPQGYFSLSNIDKEEDERDVMEVVQGILQHKLNLCKEKYRGHIQALEADNRNKQEIIAQLQQQIQQLQQSLSMLNQTSQAKERLC